MYQHVVQARGAEVEATDIPGVTIRVLWSDPASGALTVVTELAPGAAIPRHRHTHANETVFVLEGDFVEDGVPYGPGAYFVGAKGTDHGPHASAGGCRVLTHFSAALDFVMTA
jgi:anti-sigma factor ChrR (cupin superfamily)